MRKRRITVFELVPAADEVWQLPKDETQGYVYHKDGVVGLPDVASGAKLRPRVHAYYASGKATNVARVFDAFLRPDAEGDVADRAREEIAADLVTFLPGRSRPYRSEHVPGEILRQFTPGGAYVACLQARDFHEVGLSWATLPPTEFGQADRRCPNITAADGDELVNFSPYLYWDGDCVREVIEEVGRREASDIVALAGSLPLVAEQRRPETYAEIIGAIRSRGPETFVSLDVGGAPIDRCLEGGEQTSPDIFCINTDEFRGAPEELWARHTGTAVVHDKRGCWGLRGASVRERDLENAAPDVAVPDDVDVVQTICAGDAAHGGLLLGIMLYGVEDDGLQKAMVLSQACAVTVVESEEAMRGLTAEKVERNMERIVEG